MIRFMLTIGVFAVVNASAFAQPPERGVSPAFGYVRSTTPAKGIAVLVRSITVIEIVPVREKVMANGKLIEVIKHQSRQLYREADTYYDIGQSRVITPDGKQLPIDEVWKRLQPNTVVAISGDFGTPSPAFLKALAPGTIVIIPTPPKVQPAPK